MVRSESSGTPGSASASAGTPGRPSGPFVSSIQFTLTSETTPAKLIVSSTKYAPRILSASRPITHPASAGRATAATRPTHGDHSSFTVSRPDA